MGGGSGVRHRRGSPARGPGARGARRRRVARRGAPFALGAAAALFLGCGRAGYEPEALVGDGAPPGTQPDAAPGQPDGAAERLPWDEGFTVEPPVIVPELNTPSLESECFILDERTLLLSSTRPGGTGGFDMYSATRAGRGEPFTAVVELADLDSPQLDGRLVTADGLVGYFHSARPGGV